MLRLENVTKSYAGAPALQRTDLDVPAGRTTVLIGPSGCGKSTLLRLMAGLIRPDTGVVAFEGVEMTPAAAHKLRQRIGFVVQDGGLFPHLTARGNVILMARYLGWDEPRIQTRLRELTELARFPCDGLDRYPAQLSGGQRQRMGLARALAVDPKVLLLDEPFGALDARVRKELRIWLRRLHDETHTTTVIVTHDQEEAMEVADQVALMNHGRIEQIAGPRELYEHPANEFVMSFVGPVNQIGDVFVRPHDVELTLEPNGTTREAMVERIVHLGFEVRAELVRDDGERLTVQLSRDEAHALDLEEGQILYARPTRQTVFDTN
jgi:sulfate/thiosulfate transport system ATP-binding protein